MKLLSNGSCGYAKEKKQALVFSNFTFPHFFSGVLVKHLLQIPEMDKQRNPGPKIPQEDLDEEVRFAILRT